MILMQKRDLLSTPSPTRANGATAWGWVWLSGTACALGSVARDAEEWRLIPWMTCLRYQGYPDKQSNQH